MQSLYNVIFRACYGKVLRPSVYQVRRNETVSWSQGGELARVNSPSGSHLEGKVALYEAKHMKKLVRQPGISAIRGQG